MRAMAAATDAARRWSTTSRSAPVARSRPPPCCRCSREVPNIVALKDAAGNPGETAVAHRQPRRIGVEVYSGDDGLTLPLLAVGAVGVDRCGHPLDRPRPPGDVRPVGEGRHRRRPPGERPPARELRVRDRRRRPEPDPDQGDDASSRHPGGSGPAADGPTPRLRRRASTSSCAANLQRWRDAFPQRPDR